MNIKNIISSIDKKYRKNFLKKYYAKSDGKTIDEHIQDLLENRKKFEIYYPEIFNEKISDLLKLATYFHDFGKLNRLFQCKLTLHRDYKPQFCKNKISDDLIPHNFLSPLFLTDIRQEILDEELTILFYSIINHHKRGNYYISSGISGIKRLKDDLQSYWDQFQLPLEYKNETIQAYIKIIEIIVERFGTITSLNQAVLEKKHYIDLIIIITGLLIRIDHSSSGEIEVEQKPVTENREKILKNYLNVTSLRNFQEVFKDKDNLAVIADTGLGKTGLSVVWSKRKQFYVLPNRTSTNAMFETLSGIYGKGNIGLLHSTSLLYLYEKEEHDNNTVIKEYESTRALAMPVTVTTADQLFTAVFKYPCYEKIYATLSYSDVVIDEIQGFLPQQIVPMLKQIEETLQLGTRYLVITATLPGIVKHKFEAIGFSVETHHPTTFDKILRHKVKIVHDKSIFDFSVQILKTDANVLVIVNTVSTAQELYENLIKINHDKTKNINLLHSRFIWLERKEKEKLIKNPKNSVWITTQLVEASLDINYDILFTEIATADSLIQRMGRVWRHQKENYSGDYNIFIAGIVDEKKVGHVYEKILRENTLIFLQDVLIKDNFLVSEKKREIVDKLYSECFLKEIGSAYLKEWEQIESVINSGWTSLIKQDAQKLFRDTLTAEAIPLYFEQQARHVSEQLNSLKAIRDKEERKKRRIELLNEIGKYKVPVPLYWLTDKKNRTYEILNREYDILLLTDHFIYDDFGLYKNKDKFKQSKDCSGYFLE